MQLRFKRLHVENLHVVGWAEGPWESVTPVKDKVHPYLHWPNILATNFREFHWQKVTKVSQFPCEFRDFFRNGYI